MRCAQSFTALEFAKKLTGQPTRKIVARCRKNILQTFMHYILTNNFHCRKLINPLEHIKIEKSSSIFSATSCPKIINRFPAKILEKSKTFSKNEKCMLKIVNGSPPLPTNISQQRIFSPEQKIIVSSDIMTSLPTKNSKVFVTSVVNEKILYIRHADPKSNAKYQRILNEVAIFSVHAPTLNKCPVKGDCVLAAFNGEFLRAEVLLVEQGNAY